jgi:pyruvate/2-oxoglutarate/acetoin dehydrogenase E1 component
VFFAIGEDVGKIGINQLAGLQDTNTGKLRITDVGIREATIIGQGIELCVGYGLL